MESARTRPLTASILLLASGSGTRLGSTAPKAYVEVAGKALVLRSLEALHAMDPQADIVLAVDPEHRADYVEPLADSLRAVCPVQIVDGGATRQQSMANAFAAASPTSDVIVVHDAARPFFPIDAARTVIQRAAAVGGALLAVPVVDTIKSIAEAQITGTVDRSTLCAAQTPQALRRDALTRALATATRDNFTVTDDVSLLEHAGIPVEWVQGSPRNIKITTPDDLALAEHLARH